MKTNQRESEVGWLLGTAGITFLLAVRAFGVNDPDAWWHLALGRIIRANGIPNIEPFSFLPSAHSWVGQQWGYEVALSWLISIGGTGLASLGMGLVATSALIIASRATPDHAQIPAGNRGLAVIIGAASTAQLLGVRGQIISVLGAAIVLWIIARWRAGNPTPLWGLPCLFILWANLHAGFILGLGILVITISTVSIAQRFGQTLSEGSVNWLALATVVSGLGTLINPAGPRLYAYIFETFTNPTLTTLTVEWQSPDFHNFWLKVFETQAIVLVILWTLSRKVDTLDVVLAIVGLIISLQAQRNVSLFVVIATPQIATYSVLVWQRYGKNSRLANGKFLVTGTLIIVCTCLVLTPNLTYAATQDSESTYYPQAAINYINLHPHLIGQHFFTPYEWGGYLAYRFPYDHMVYIYGESAILGNSRLQSYLNIFLLRSNWKQTLRNDKLDYAIVPDNSQEATAFQTLGWSRICTDSKARALLLASPQADYMPPVQVTC